MQEAYRKVRKFAHAALDYKHGESWADLEQRATDAGLSKPAVGVTAASNYGVDTILFVKVRSQTFFGETSCAEPLDILIQSKYTEGETNQTFQYALLQARKDTRSHNIDAGEARKVAGEQATQSLNPRCFLGVSESKRVAVCLHAGTTDNTSSPEQLGLNLKLFAEHCPA